MSLARNAEKPAVRTDGPELEPVQRMTDAPADPSVSADIPDWSREAPELFWDPGRKLLSTIRGYQYWRARSSPLARLLRMWLVLRYRFWSVVTGAEISLGCTIGGGLRIPHPNGIVIHSDAVIGVNCLIFQQVTIGTQGNGVPQIAGHVDIGAGAKILGPITIGPHAKIGANAVVLEDVPESAVAVGVPAKILQPSASRPSPDPYIQHASGETS
jgi:serine O-acetyltransferase